MCMLTVCEIFGPTIQGEGPWIGQKCIFVRFYGCDYKCSFCDQKEEKAIFSKTSVYEIFQKI